MCAYTHVTYQSFLLPPAYLTQTYHSQHEAKASLQTLFLQCNVSSRLRVYDTPTPSVHQTAPPNSG